MCQRAVWKSQGMLPCIQEAASDERHRAEGAEAGAVAARSAADASVARLAAAEALTAAAEAGAQRLAAARDAAQVCLAPI